MYAAFILCGVPSAAVAAVAGVAVTMLPQPPSTVQGHPGQYRYAGLVILPALRRGGGLERRWCASILLMVMAWWREGR